MLKALLVDLDGTLADSLPLLYRVYHVFLASRQIEGSREEFESLNGLTILEVMQQLVSTYHLSEEPKVLAEQYSRNLDEHYQNALELFPFARKCLIYAKERGLKIALVTSAKKGLVDAFIKRHNLEIDFIVTGEGLKQGKPSPEIYLKALKIVNVKGEEALAIEDAPHGINAALAAGIPVIHFKEGQQWREVFERLKIEEIVHPDFPAHPAQEIDVLVQKNDTQQTTPEIERIWKEKTKQNPRLFNGEIFRFLSFDDNCLKGEFVSYKEYVASLESHSVIPVAVNGVIEADGAILLGKRAMDVTVSGGLWQTVPSGAIDPVSQVEDRIDIFKQMKVELFEETDLKEEEIVLMTPFSLVQDKIDMTWEICFFLEVKERREVASPDGEYTEMRWVKKEELLSFIENEYHAIIPFNRYLLACLL